MRSITRYIPTALAVLVGSLPSSAQDGKGSPGPNVSYVRDGLLYFGKTEKAKDSATCTLFAVDCEGVLAGKGPKPKPVYQFESGGNGGFRTWRVAHDALWLNSSLSSSATTVKIPFKFLPLFDPALAKAERFELVKKMLPLCNPDYPGASFSFGNFAPRVEIERLRRDNNRTADDSDELDIHYDCLPVDSNTVRTIVLTKGRVDIDDRQLVSPRPLSYCFWEWAEHAERNSKFKADFFDSFHAFYGNGLYYFLTAAGELYELDVREAAYNPRAKVAMKSVTGQARRITDVLVDTRYNAVYAYVEEYLPKGESRHYHFELGKPPVIDEYKKDDSAIPNRLHVLLRVMFDR